jgi:hypothetical protein
LYLKDYVGRWRFPPNRQIRASTYTNVVFIRLIVSNV